MALQPDYLLSNSQGPPRPPANLPLVQTAWQRKWTVVAGVLAGLLLGGLYCQLSRPVYQATAQVLVLKKHPDIITGVDTRGAPVEDYVSTHQVLIKSPVIIDRAIAKGRLASLPSLAGQSDVTDWITRGLTVSRNKGPVGENNVLELSFRGKDANDCRVVLSAVLESYKDFLDETYKAMGDDTLKLIARARDDLQNDLDQKNAAYVEFAKQSPLPGKAKEGLELRLRRLDTIQAQRSALLLRRAKVQAQLEALETARTEKHSPETLVAMVSDFSGRSDSDELRREKPLTLQEQLLPLLMEEEKLRQSLGANHPDVQSVRTRIEAAREFFARPSPAWRAPAGAAQEPAAAAATVGRYVDYLKQKLNQIKIEEELHTTLFNAELAEARKLTSYAIQDEMLLARIASTQQLYDNDVKRLKEVRLIMDVGGYYPQTIAPPAAGRQVAPRPLLAMPVAAFLGLMCGLGGAYLAAARDKRFRSADEVPQQLGIPLVGTIPLFRPDGAAWRQLRSGEPAPDPMLCTHYRPRSLEAEAFRSLRTALYFSTLGQGRKVIEITSPGALDGKSTLAANLAVAIAQSGKRVVLVDADLRTPRVHKLFGLLPTSGLASVLAGTAEPQEAVQASGIDGLSVLPCGPLPANPAELLTSPAFKDLLELLREQSDFVIVDTPPLLEVTDASVVASRVDGVLLTLRLGKNGRPAAEAAAETLAAVGATLLGVVVNGTDRRSGPAGYRHGPYLDRPADRYPVAVAVNGTDAGRDTGDARASALDGSP